MAGIRQTFDRSGKPHAKWRYWYLDWRGKRIWATGTDDPDYTLRLAESKELRDQKRRRSIELGVEAAPTSAQINRARSVRDVVDEYLAWGKAQGGRGGRPWAVSHIESREYFLAFWLKALNLQTLSDFEGLLPRAERALREYRVKGKGDTMRPPAGKTLANVAEALRALCHWAKQRGYLDRDPLDGMASFDAQPVTERRAMEPGEIRKLLESCAPQRRLLYEVAFCTGLRANELRQLTPRHLDSARCGLILEASWTKSRKKGFQPLPAELVRRLEVAAEEKTAAGLYMQHTWQGTRKRASPRIQRPADPLLYVPTHPSRELEKDLRRAGMTKHGPGGKVDFHACRVAYTTLIFDVGGNLKEAQTLARHSDPRITANIYGKTRDGRLHGLAESVAERILPPDSCATGVQRVAAGAEYEANSNTEKSLQDQKWWRRRESNPGPKMFPTGHLRV
jgi:integrase